MTITNISDREIALQARVKELEEEHTVFLGQKNWIMKSHNQACDARDALQARVAELEAIEKQLSDNVIWQAGEIAKHLATIEASRKQDPVLYQRRMKPDYGPHWSAWDDCSEATFKQCLTVPKLHDWTHESRALYANPVVAPDVLTRLEKAENNVRNATNVIQSILNGKTSPMLAQQVVNALNEFLDSTMGGANAS